MVARLRLLDDEFDAELSSGLRDFVACTIMKGKPGDEWRPRVEELMLLHCLKRGEGVSEMQL